MTCPACGVPIVEGARFCAACGQSLTRRSDERRVVTVLFADLVGFTTLSETLDPEQVKNLVDRCFERLVADVTAFGGRVDKIVGDAILALFGAPLAHEDDAERAVRCGLQMQESLLDHVGEAADGLRMRVGINTGEVLVGALRAGGDYTAMGDVVNTASRLQTSAQPGSVVVGAATYAATRQLIRYTPLGAVQAKGREAPVDAWIAEESLMLPGARPHRGRAPLVGRDGELRMLAQAVETAVTHHRGHLLLLVGEAGMGKTRLAEEVASIAACDHEAVVLEGRCLPYGEANVWWPVAEALRQGCDIKATDAVHVARGLAEARIREAVADSASNAEVERLADGLLHVMGYDGPLAGIDPARAREEITRSVLALLDGWARHQPVVIVLSDLHWADQVVLDLGTSLLERVASHQVVLIATARQDLFARWQPTAARHNLIILNLDPLDRESTATLLDALSEGGVPADMRELLLDRSGGNPFFLEELVSLIVDGGQVDFAELPHTLRGLVAARLDGLTPTERSVLEDAAVLGRRGSVEAIQLMAEKAQGIENVEDALESLVNKELLVVDDGRWSFKSDLVREVMYGTLTKADRARRHTGVAMYMEAHAGSYPGDTERIAHHFATAAQLVAELGTVEGVPPDVATRALHWLDKALARAEADELHVVAARLSAQALELEPLDHDNHMRFLLARSRSLTVLRDLDAAEAELKKAMEVAAAAGDDAGRGLVLLTKGDYEQKRGDLAASASTYDEAIDVLTAVGDEHGVAEAERGLGMTLLFLGDTMGARAAFEEALARFRAEGDRRGEGWALQNLAWEAYTSGRVDDAERWLTESVDTFSEIRDAGGMGWALGLMAFLRFHQGRYEEAETLGEQIYSEARERGDQWATGMMLVLLSSLRLWNGRVGIAVEQAEEARSNFRLMGDWYGELLAVGMHGRALIGAGRIDDGFEVLLDGLNVADSVPVSHAREMALIQLRAAAAQAGQPGRSPEEGTENIAPDEVGWLDRQVSRAVLELQSGDCAGAIERLERAAVECESFNGYVWASLALARAATGDIAGVRTTVAEVEAGQSSTLNDKVTARLALALAEARAGDEAAAEAALASTRALADPTDSPLLHTQTDLASGWVHERLHGDNAGAVELRRARQSFADMGAPENGWDTAFRLASGG